MGHAGQVASPGDFFPCTLGRIPALVVQDDAGQLRGFVNVCRHRGSVVVEEPGNRRTLQCPYHAWTYGLDGRLRSAPRSDWEPGFEVSDVSLAPILLERWGPFLFANADVEATPLEEILGDLPEHVAAAGVDVDAVRFHHRLEYDVEANWKIVSENFLECYHCPVAHPGFSALVDVSPDAYRLETSTWFSSQFGPLRSDAASPYASEGELERGQFHFLWPNTGINMFPGRANLSIGPIQPAEPERTRRILDYFFAPDADEGWIADLLAFDDQVGREDTRLVERVQRGAGSGALDRGRLLPRSEKLVAHFQRLVEAALAA